MILRAFITLLTSLLVVPSQGASIFLQGDYGKIPLDEDKGFVKASLKAATKSLMDILEEEAGASGDETLVPDDVMENEGEGKGTTTTHIRYHEFITLDNYENIPVERAALMMHIDEKGRIFAVNGEFVSARDLRHYEFNVPCRKAMNSALKQLDITDGTWVDGCNTMAIVTDDEDVPHVTWKRQVNYGVYNSDVLYASTETGDVIAVSPQVMTGHDGNGGHNTGIMGGWDGGNRGRN